MEWERARTREQKQQRINEIIEATARLYEKLDFEDITFVSIAREAGFTRSNLYKYFNSKEDIFLEFLKQDLVLWETDLTRAFEKGRNYSIGEFAEIWADKQVKHERLLGLIAILHVFLEKNTSYGNLIAFKSRVTEELRSLFGLLSGLFPGMTPDKSLCFFHLQLASAIGLYQMSNLSEVQNKVLSLPEFQHFKVDFRPFFRESVEYILKGLLK